MEINIILIALAAFVGGLATALLGWTERATPWDWKKFTTSMIRSFVGAIVIAAAMDYSGVVTPILYLFAFLSGAGIEVGGNRVAGALKKRATE